MESVKTDALTVTFSDPMQSLSEMAELLSSPPRREITPEPLTQCELWPRSASGHEAEESAQKGSGGPELAEITPKEERLMLVFAAVHAQAGQVIPSNPARSVRTPRHSVRKGATAVISSMEAGKLFDSMDATTIVGLRDRAIVAVMAFTFACVSAVVGLKVEGYYPQKERWWMAAREERKG